MLTRTRSNRLTRTRAVNGIDQNTNLNRALWSLAEKNESLESGLILENRISSGQVAPLVFDNSVLLAMYWLNCSNLDLINTCRCQYS